MGNFNIRVTNNDVTMFKKRGDLAVIFGDGMTQFTAPSVQLGTDDVGRVFSGNQQMNPMGDKVPSTVVSPQSTWNPTLPQLNIAFSVILAITVAIAAIEDELEYDDGQGRVLGRPIRRESYQIVDFEAFLPEDLTI